MIMDNASFIAGLRLGLRLGRRKIMNLITKLIRSNGTYRASEEGAEGYSAVTVNVSNSYTAADEGKVVQNGALEEQGSLSVTQNGVYDTTTDKLVTVYVSGGGDVPLLTRAQWNALTKEQKRAYGLLAIQDRDSSFDRGELVYGADYVGTLLTASNPSSILAEELWDSYEGGTKWGAVNISGTGYLKTADAVRFPIGSMGSIELPNANYSVTAYAVINNYTPTSGDLSMLAVPYAFNARNQPAFFVRSGVIWTTVYGSDTSTGIPSNAWHVLTLALDNTNKTCRYYIDGVPYSSKTYSNSGSIVSLSASTVYSQASMNADVAWVGVVSGAESESVIYANHVNIMSQLSDYFGS